MIPQLDKRLFSVKDYHKMAVVGILKPSDRVELIKGKIIKKSPIKSYHASVVDILAEELLLQLHRLAAIRVQNPIQIDAHSELEPDIAVVKFRQDRYLTQPMYYSLLKWQIPLFILTATPS